MKLVENLVNFLRSLEESVAMLRSPSILLPFVVFAAVQSLVLMACAFFTVPPLSTVMVPLIRLISGEQSLHFPMHFVLLPGIYHSIYLPLVVVVGFVLFGRAVFGMGDYYQRQGSSIGTRPPMLRSIPSMILIGLLYVLLATAPIVLFEYASTRTAAAPVRRALPVVGVLLSLSFQSLLVYSLLFLRAGAGGPAAAVKKSVGFARSRFPLTFMLVLTVYVIHRPIDYVVSRPDKVVLRFDPEMVFFLLLGGILLELVTSYLLFSSTTSIALARKKEGFG